MGTRLGGRGMGGEWRGISRRSAIGGAECQAVATLDVHEPRNFATRRALPQSGVARTTSACLCHYRRGPHGTQITRVVRCFSDPSQHEQGRKRKSVEPEKRRVVKTREGLRTGLKSKRSCSEIARKLQPTFLAIPFHRGSKLFEQRGGGMETELFTGSLVGAGP